MRRTDEIIAECRLLASEIDGHDDQAADTLYDAANELERLAQLYRPGYVSVSRKNRRERIRREVGE